MSNPGDNDRRLYHPAAQLDPGEVQPSTQLIYDTRIDIDGEMQSANNSNGLQQNITSIFNQARSELERRSEQTRMWRLNLNNVLNQGVRPLIAQSAQYHDNFRVPQFRSLTPSPEALIQPDLVDNGRESFNLNVPTEPNRTDTNTVGGGVVEPREHFSRPHRPILDRVAALTLNDPPDLIERQDNNAGGALSDVLSQVPDARRFLVAITGCVPFVCILLVKLLYDNFGAVFDIFGLSALFYYINCTVRKQFVKQAQCSKLILLRDAAAIVLGVFYIITERTKSVYNLFLIRTVTDISLGSLLYSTIVTDYILKFITILVKMFVAVLPAEIIPYERRCRFYMLIESIFQLYRTIAPIQLWLVFLLDSYFGIEKLFGSVLTMAYMIPKLLAIVERIKFIKKAIAVFPRKVRYGTVPTKENIEKVGDQCPICHDAFDTPVLLNCNHIFCENCVGIWFNTEQTCPMCRAKVAEDPAWLDGATMVFVQCF